MCFLHKTDRTDTSASHKMKEKNSIDMVEILAPSLATIFQFAYMSG